MDQRKALTFSSESHSGGKGKGALPFLHGSKALGSSTCSSLPATERLMINNTLVSMKHGACLLVFTYVDRSLSSVNPKTAGARGLNQNGRCYLALAFVLTRYLMNC